MASFNPMSYFSPTSVFSLSTFLPSYLVTSTLTQPEPQQTRAKNSDARLGPDESEESGDSRRTDTEAEAKGSSELNNQHSQVFLFTSSSFLYKYDEIMLT